MYQDQNAGKNENIKIENNFIGRVEVVKYLGTTLSIEDSTQIEIKGGLKRLRWSRGSLLAFGTQVRGFAPGRSRRKSSARLPSEGK